MTANKDDALDPAPASTSDRAVATPRWRTADLIARLRELDPTGERTVFLEIGRESSLDTDSLCDVYVEDGNAVWDAARLRIVLTNVGDESDGDREPNQHPDDVLDIPLVTGEPGVIVTAYVTCPECGQGFLAMADEKVTGCVQHGS